MRLTPSIRQTRVVVASRWAGRVRPVQHPPKAIVSRRSARSRDPLILETGETMNESAPALLLGEGKATFIHQTPKTEAPRQRSSVVLSSSHTIPHDPRDLFRQNSSPELFPSDSLALTNRTMEWKLDGWLDGGRGEITS